MKKILLILLAAVTCGLFADVYLIDGERVEGEVHDEGGMKTICTDEMCLVIPDDAICLEGKDAKAPPAEEPKVEVPPVEVVKIEEPAAPMPEFAEPALEPTAEIRPWNVYIKGFMNVKECKNFLRVPEYVQKKEVKEARRAQKSREGKAESIEGKSWMKRLLDQLENADSLLEGKSWWVVLLIALLGGFIMNLTPCVLPMVPINLMIIGKSATRGALYGLGITLAYGILGLLAALCGLIFGSIQGSPWFNLAIASLFIVLGLSMLGVFAIDFSKGRGSIASWRGKMNPSVFAFVMGVVSAILAGACVVPVLVAVITYTADQYAAGHTIALALPFVFGLGMAMPWPLMGSGLQVLPKPGAWMPWVNKIFGILLFGAAVWYVVLACIGIRARLKAPSVTMMVDEDGSTTYVVTSPKAFVLNDYRQGDATSERRPIFVDCWASWCKNCSAMERNTLSDPAVRELMKHYIVVKLQCEDISELVDHPDFKMAQEKSGKKIRGLPTFVIFE